MEKLHFMKKNLLNCLIAVALINYLKPKKKLRTVFAGLFLFYKSLTNSNSIVNGLRLHTNVKSQLSCNTYGWPVDSLGS